MKKFSQKGFTLIELMIVLAIIAILAVVLVPKAGQMKDSARNAGVTTNVNAVRGALEAKVVDTNYLGNYANTLTLLTSNFNTTLANPFNANAKNVDATGVFTDTDVSARNDSIVIWKSNNAVSSVTSFAADIAKYPLSGTSTNAVNKGDVCVVVYSDGYVVFGVDSTNTVVNVATIK